MNVGCSTVALCVARKCRFRSALRSSVVYVCLLIVFARPSCQYASTTNLQMNTLTPNQTADERAITRTISHPDGFRLEMTIGKTPFSLPTSILQHTNIPLPRIHSGDMS
ncbi:hypothetical protein BKA63DRAFT_170296 [Paraphoma chrysanthemicola]|nr:hypothetical protein BKA63DRAFT_170296 [Paraphoma chrysanthemicola]